MTWSRGGISDHCIVPELRIGTESEFLSLTPLSESGPPKQAIVQLALEGVSASVTIPQHWSGGFDDLAGFFLSLEKSWRGWSGTKTWRSLEDDMGLDARHTGGHVQLRVTMRRVKFDRSDDGWSVVGDLTIDPGEQLTRVARDVVAFARGS